MRVLSEIFIFLVFVAGAWKADAIEVERFEQIDTRNGLSQNNVQSLFCDHQGYLWAGTMNGLNRYDGNNFKIFRSDPTCENSLTQNRVVEIFEDERQVLWVKTNDRYCHYFIRNTEEFISFPSYSKTPLESNSFVTVFFQYDRDQIWIGSSRSGLYQLNFDSISNRYQTRQYLSPVDQGQPFPYIHFIVKSKAGDLFVGTEKTLFYVSASSLATGTPEFRVIMEGHVFKNGAIDDKSLWIGTKTDGLFQINLEGLQVQNLSPVLQPIQKITFLTFVNHKSILAIGTLNQGFYLYNLLNNKLTCFSTLQNESQYVFVDRFGLLWLKSRRSGVSKINLSTLTERHFELILPDSKPLIDDEETLFFEDSRNNLWIASQGTGLGWYNRDKDSIEFFRYDHTKPGTISSNHILCMTEDHTGTLWVGTTHTNGGLNKMIMVNPSFRHLAPTRFYSDESENLVRSLFCDRNGFIWVGTKAGTIHIYSPDFTRISTIQGFDKRGSSISGFNPYCIMQDKKGYIWIGIKGSGISVSSRPLSPDPGTYKNLEFFNYRQVDGDTASLSSNLIYSIKEDSVGQIWIGTFNKGINRVIERTDTHLTCQVYSDKNSRLSSQFVRNLLVDDNTHHLWIATNFGINVVPLLPDGGLGTIRNYLYDPKDPDGLGYNDVVHLFKDTRGWIWCATFGGGISLVEDPRPEYDLRFRHFSSSNGLINDAVYAIEEDQDGNMWFSTEKGISKLEIPAFTFENFGKNSGIVHENFCENTSATTKNGQLLFGNLKGFVIIDPKHISLSRFVPELVLSKFSINNREVDFREKKSPLKCPIEETDHLVLNYRQSNFSIEFAALDFKASEALRYQFRLDPFDKDWSSSSGQKMASYTNLNPGHYTFRVRSTNSDGVWNETEKILTIYIRPPYWKTWWFRILGFFILVSGFVFFLQQREVTFKKSKLMLEQKVEERTMEIVSQKEKIELQNKELDEANRLKTRFFNIIAHDLKNPVISFNQLTDQLVENYHSFSETERANIVQFVSKSARQILILLDELLIWARAQSNRIDYQFASHELSGLVKLAVDSVELMALNKPIMIKNRCREPIQVYCDENSVTTILRNLLTNAIKFSNPDSYIEIGCTLHNKFVHIFVKDFGIGISDDIQKKLFRIDEKITSRGTSGEQGTGLGLYICYEFVKGNGGSIWFESQKGKGSVFWFSLPLNEKALSGTGKS